MMRTALDNPELRDKIGSAGRKRVVSNWSWAHTAKRTEAHYRTVLADHAKAHGA